MTIQMEIGLRRLQALPALCRKAQWVEGLTDKDISTPTEFSELNRLNLQYTSLRDLISSTHTKGGFAKEVDWCDISQVKFKDRLLKQAAWAYLQPMVVETNQEIHFLTRFWTKLTNNKSLVASMKEYVESPIEAFIDFFTIHVYSKLSRAFDLLVQRFKPHLFGVLRVRATQMKQ